MASPPANGDRHWSASPWLPLEHAAVARSPDTFGVIILGDAHRDPILISHGAIRNELWRLNRSPRIAAQGPVQFRYIETRLEREAELLAVIVREELARAAGHGIVWREFPASGLVEVASVDSQERSGAL